MVLLVLKGTFDLSPKDERGSFILPLLSHMQANNRSGLSHFRLNLMQEQCGLEAATAVCLSMLSPKIFTSFTQDSPLMTWVKVVWILELKAKFSNCNCLLKIVDL